MEPLDAGVGMSRCAKLQWKGLFVEAGHDPTVQPSNDRTYWCQHTFTCLGPDGKIVDGTECNAARSCYEEL